MRFFSRKQKGYFPESCLYHFFRIPVTFTDDSEGVLFLIAVENIDATDHQLE